MSVEMITALMLISLIATVMLGFPIGFSLAGIATIFGMIFVGPQIANAFMLRLYVSMSDYTLIAIPLFVFMGIIIEKSGLAGKLYDAIYVLTGRLKGGLAIATVLTCTIFAAATGVVGATVVTMGIMSLPAMMKYEYDKPLACGSVCAGGALGILIPPSILILVYAPVANISVGALLIGAFVPGLVLAMLYVLYIGIRCYLKPSMGPSASASDINVPTAEKVKMFATSVLPVLALIFAVLGTIFFGLAAPTEAAAIGALASVLLAAAYRKLTWENLKEAAVRTARTSAMVYLVVIGASFFTSVFMRLGSGKVIENLILGLPFGPWGILITMWLVIIVMGCFLDWIGIIMIVVPLFTPIAVTLGFNPVWFSLMNIVVLQTSFLTPPFALTIFYLKGIAPPEINLGHIYKGVVPFLLLMIVALVIFALFPNILLFAPRAGGLI
ncbi:MAG: TRAP transporter large permease subunit [Clostridiales bacterium]|jgi:tripartite ATP-independent transporter DctM subunit|nr:TRAP transporter large permease subunit [Clostridiales bacterium]